MCGILLFACECMDASSKNADTMDAAQMVNNMAYEHAICHAAGDRSAFERPLPDRYMSLGDISAGLGAPAHRWGGEQ